jgi:antitoxin component of RelBE/YafQ-DinJ toxin-antitoxin module
MRTKTDVKTSVKMASVTKTPVSNFRIPVDIKEAAQAKAEAEGKTLSRVVVDLLREYAREKK